MMRSSIVGLALLFVPLGVQAYEVDTHRDITSVAATRADVEAMLQEDLGFTDGLRTTIRGRSLAAWMVEAAAKEDNFPRFLNHFHNPVASNWSRPATS